MLESFPHLVAAVSEGVDTPKSSVSQDPVPPLSPKTLALAAELEVRRQQETLMQAVALAVAATTLKLGGGMSMTLTQADFDRATKDGNIVQMVDLKKGEIVSVRIIRKVEVANE